MLNDQDIKVVFDLIKDNNIKFVDLRFTDIKGKEHHLSLSAEVIDKDFFIKGKVFDGSSLSSWKAINDSDMLLIPIITSAVIDPFYEIPTLVLRCNVYDPRSNQPYDRDPRFIALKAEQYLKEMGIADSVIVGPEPEFFLFSDVRYKIEMGKSFYKINDLEASWSSAKKYDNGNLAHHVPIKGGYLPLPPIDSSQNIRSKMCLMLEHFGLKIEAHHHEVATCGQNEIACRFNTLTLKADEIQNYKYVIHNVAKQYNKTACFMPKPIYGDNGSGMHCHVSMSKGGENIFAGDAYAGLSELALYYIGGVIKHAKAINAFSNPTTNSYKRLVAGFEAPVILAYSQSNRSAAIRIPFSYGSNSSRIEVRFPDPAANPYLAFSAILMAGIDGIKNKIHPQEAQDRNLYDLTPAELASLPKVASSLEEALENLSIDNDFLTAGGVFSKDFIEVYIALKQEECNRLKMHPHPLEFEMYYNN